jgi:hypothetical protein
MAFRLPFLPLVLWLAVLSGCVSTGPYHQVYNLPPLTVHVADLATVRAEFAARFGRGLPVYGWVTKQTRPGSGEVVSAEVWTIRYQHTNDPFAQLVLGHEVGHLIADMSEDDWIPSGGGSAVTLLPDSGQGWLSSQGRSEAPFGWR